jgi:hypothetical protein
MSAARLAAEAAFEVAHRQAAVEMPSVTVRRVRGVRLGSDSASAQWAVPQAQSDTATSRDPRVFRLVPGAGPGREPVEPGRVVAESSALVAVAPAGQGNQGSNGRRKRRSSTAQRPGPVVQVFKAPTDSAVAVDRTVVVMPGAPTFIQLAALQEMLAGLQSLLEQAQQAREFRILETDRLPNPTP